jgi:chemotaxis methyl-accepting protein methylase
VTPAPSPPSRAIVPGQPLRARGVAWEPSPQLLEELAQAAAQVTGFSRDAILPEAVRRAAQSLTALHSPEELAARLRSNDASVASALSHAVTVGETYFFRHAEHFRFLTSRLLPELLAGPPQRLRFWSAGCATGEEVWSLAACLADALPATWHGAPPAVEVLGTDLLPRNLASAQRGLYGPWSQRPSAPLLHPVVEPAPPGSKRASKPGVPLVQVLARLRPLVRLEPQNLLSAPAEGLFHAIFCRNVLVYFSPEAAARVLEHLASALAPGGALLLGSMDAQSAPPGLLASGSPQDQIWRKPDPARPSHPLAAEERPVTPLLPSTRRTPEPIALHLRALVLVERGQHLAAARALGDLVQKAPDYVPGLLERALLHVRQGERSAATRLMREVLRRASALDEDEGVAGPETLPARFYVQSAEAFLRGRAP